MSGGYNGSNQKGLVDIDIDFGKLLDYFTPATVKDAARNIDDWISGPPTDATLGQSEYDFTYRVFPNDIGEGYQGHYMIINIAVQTATKLSTVNNQRISTTFGDLPFNGKVYSQLSKTDALRYTIDDFYKDQNGESLKQYNVTQRPRFTRRIRESIALYMPNSELTFTDAHEFTGISLTDFSGSVVGAVNKIAGAAIGGIAWGGPVGGGMGAVIAGNITDMAGNLIQKGSGILGTPINPRVEVIFANTGQREFMFDFIFSPSSVEESVHINQIIQTLRFHAAPEMKVGLVDSFFYVPPSEFDITFYHRGKENTKIPRINTCVLSRIDTSFTPNGTYSTFHNGFPTQIRLGLGFREVEVVHKLRVLQGF